ncbi:MAG: hypothetical protein ACYTDX_05865 [Planctomycetota bacterium]|jgi:hypothetical protein
MRKKMISAVLAGAFLLGPAAAQSGSDGIAWHQYDGYFGAGMAILFFGRPTGPYTTGGREVEGREGKTKDKVKLAEEDCTLYAYDDWWEMEGLAPGELIDNLEGSMTTKNDKVYKVANLEDFESFDDFLSWVENYVEIYGSETAQVDEASMKGKLKLNKKDGSVKFSIKLKYLGTTTSGADFGSKAKGKFKFKGVVEPAGDIDP